MSGIRFDITLADGKRIEGARIHGTGGEIGVGVLHLFGTDAEEHALAWALARIRAIIRIVGKGHRCTSIFQPIPGRARAYVGEWKDDVADESTVDFPLAGATVELHAQPHALALRGRS